MLNTAIVGLGWWGKTLVKAARDFGAPIRFVRGVTLEPETVGDFAADAMLDEVEKIFGAWKAPAADTATPKPDEATKE